jgi:hypothetical protein
MVYCHRHYEIAGNPSETEIKCQLCAYADDVNLLGDNKYCEEKHGNFN